VNHMMEQHPKRPQFLAWFLAMIVSAGLVFVAWLPMTWHQQIVFAAVMVVASMLGKRFLHGQRMTYFLILMSLCAALRYGIWRAATLYHYLREPWTTPDWVTAGFMVLLFFAEAFEILILILGFVQNIAPLKRPPVPLPQDITEWPTVDVLIPTYNEPLNVVRSAVLAAAAIDWPQDRMRVLILDDGDREEFREFAAEAEVGYITREEHKHAKAGNINHALELSEADYVAIFDCDHIPTRSFLQVTMGWFLRDSKLGILQTPHHFYSPDPVERNLNRFRSLPNEGELFYGLIQDGNDLWNATFFCGSCAVIRRKALDEIGGIAVETVTEDAHTSLRMQMKGWNTAYLNMVQAAGLATESIGGHVQQRSRWARGMVQILRIDNPLLAPGLSLVQRLCYLNAMLHFMYALPRLIFLSSPLLYLIFGRLNMPGYWVTILVFAIPHLILSTLTSSRIQGKKRLSFWNEIYETILTPYILFPTWLALFNPRYGKFNVTAKGAQQDDRFDLSIGWPFLAMLGANAVGMVMAALRWFYWDREHHGTIVMNVLWMLFNTVILGVALGVCCERRQRRGAVRIDARIPVQVIANGNTYDTFSENISDGGAAVNLPGNWALGQDLTISFREDAHGTPIRSKVAGQTGKQVRISFGDMNLQERRAVVSLIYSRADRWMDWNSERPDENILLSFGRIVIDSTLGIRYALKMLFRPNTVRRESAAPMPQTASSSTVSTLLILALLLLPSHRAHAARQHAAAATVETSRVQELKYSLVPASLHAPLRLDEQAPLQSIQVAIPATLLLDEGRLFLQYDFAPGSRAEAVTINVTLNKTLIAVLTPRAEELAAGHASTSVPLPIDLFVQRSKLNLELTSVTRAGCTANASSSETPWVNIDPASGIVVHGSELRVADDLSVLPDPFLQHTLAGTAPVTFVFAQQPDWQLLRAAGITASWFGMHAQDDTPTFHVRLASLPPGNAVVLLSGAETVNGLSADGQAAVAIQPNPVDPYGKLLILSAPSRERLLELAQSFASGQLQLEGMRSVSNGYVPPAPRKADDAPAWVQGDRVPLGALPGSDSLSATDQGAVLYPRLPPDLNFNSNNGAANSSYLRIKYAAGPGALASASNIAVSFNGARANSVPVQASLPGKFNQVYVPLLDLPFGFRNTLIVHLYALSQGVDRCSAAGNTAQGNLLGDSYLDLGRAIHLAQLPDLKFFSNAGYPFTRFADLGHTAVLLADRPDESAMALYLDLMSYFGGQTGYPVLRAEVAGVHDAASFADRDLLWIGTYSDAAKAAKIGSHLPLQPWQADSPLTFRAQWVLKLKELLHLGDSTVDSVSSEAASGGGLIETSESPYGADRTLVAVLGRGPDQVAAMANDLIPSMPLDEVNGNTSIWTHNTFHSFVLSQEHYLVGDAPTDKAAEYWLALYPWIPAGLLLLLCAVAAIWIQLGIAHQRRARLIGTLSNQEAEV
jgi:cellulose synthase (UDP-forming)